MNFRKSRKLMWTGFAIGLLIMTVGLGHESENIIRISMITGAIIFFAAMIQAFIFYTCPHCGYSLMNVRGPVPEHCPKCGAELKEK